MARSCVTRTSARRRSMPYVQLHIRHIRPGFWLCAVAGRGWGRGGPRADRPICRGRCAADTGGEVRGAPHLDCASMAGPLSGGRARRPGASPPARTAGSAVPSRGLVALIEAICGPHTAAVGRDDRPAGAAVGLRARVASPELPHGRADRCCDRSGVDDRSRTKDQARSPIGSSSFTAARRNDRTRHLAGRSHRTRHPRVRRGRHAATAVPDPRLFTQIERILKIN